MDIVQQTRQSIGDTLRRRSIHRHRSRIGWQDAPRYTRYLSRARKAFREELPPLNGEMSAALATFRKDGAACFATDATADVAQQIYAKIQARAEQGEHLWADDTEERGQHNYTGDVWRDFPEVARLFQGDLGAFLTNYFRSHIKILYGSLYRSVGHDGARVGSQRWHSDSGPGICVNVMFYLHETQPEDGTMETLPWDASRDIYDDEPAEIRRRISETPGTDRRTAMADYYDDVIARRFANRVTNASGPAGLVVPFLNNTLHRGGYPAPGRTRTAIVFHCYPSHTPIDLDRYARDGIAKTVPYPKDPAETF